MEIKSNMHFYVGYVTKVTYSFRVGRTNASERCTKNSGKLCVVGNRDQVDRYKGVRKERTKRFIPVVRLPFISVLIS